jgi:hypothetical protein
VRSVKGVQEYKEYKESEEFKERNQELEFRSQETLGRARVRDVEAHPPLLVITDQ